MRVYWESGGPSPRIHGLGSVCGKGVSVTHPPLYLCGDIYRYSLDSRLTSVEAVRYRNWLPVSGMEHQFPILMCF